MAIGSGSLIEIAVVASAYQQVQMNVWTYVVGTFPVTPSAGEIAEAWWNHVKTAYRGIVAANYDPFFAEVNLRELDDPLGEFGTYSIPSGERAGSRTGGSGDIQPSFLATGTKLAVGTRATRPGQKRIGGLLEGDVTAGVISGTVITAVEALMTVAAGNIALGAPALATVLDCVIVKRDPATGLPLAWQPVTGYTVSNQATTQNSRKIGRGV